MKTKFTIQQLLLLLLCLFQLHATQAQSINVADFSTARAKFVSGSTTYTYNLTGTEMVYGRAKLTNTANFGTSGIVPHPLNITTGLFVGTGSVTAAALAPYDIVFLPVMASNMALTTAEQNALYTWSQQPGKVILSCEQAGYSQYSARSGYSISNGNTNPTTRIATGDDIYHLFNGGVFGNAVNLTQSGSAQGYFTADCFAAAIGKNASNNSTIIFNAITRDLYFADGGFFTSGAQTASGITAGAAITSDADKIWGNTWAWAINEVLNPGTNTTTPVISTSTGICTANDGTITVTSPLGTNTLGQTYQYALNSGAYQSSPNFINLSPGVYTLHVKTSACTDVTATVSIDSRDYGNLQTTGAGTNWPAAYASIPNAGAIWLGATPATFECVTNVNDPADGFNITGSGVTGNGTSSSPYALLEGLTYNFNITVNGSTAGTVYWGIWYDVNADGDFNDPDDIFRSGSAVQNASATAITPESITVPGAPVGATQGRVRIVATATNTTFTKAMMNGTFAATNGEVEDYYVSYAIALPLSLENFSAEKNGNNAGLKWTTLTEQNTKNFEVQESGSGTAFSTIGKVSAAGNSNHKITYQFTQSNVAAGTHYYRLKMIDADGAFTYSAVRILNFGTVASQVSVYPNPASKLVTVSGVETGNIIRILNVDGTLITQVTATGSSKDINISSFAKGVYVVQVIKQKTVVNTVRIVKN